MKTSHGHVHGSENIMPRRWHPQSWATGSLRILKIHTVVFSLFAGIVKPISKFIRKFQEPRVAQIILRKDEAGGLTSYLKTYHTATAVKMARTGLGQIQTDGSGLRITCSQSIQLNEHAKTIPRGKEQSNQKTAGPPGEPQAQVRQTFLTPRRSQLKDQSPAPGARPPRGRHRASL